MSLNYSPKIVTNGLVLCLDAGDPRSYSGSGTIWTDRSGLGNNGTLVNGVGYSSANRGSLVFDGVNDIVQTSYGPQLNDFTAIAWFRSTGSPLNYSRIIDKSYNTGFWVGRDSTRANRWGGGVLEGNPPFGRYITLQDDQWNMIVSCRQGTTHTIYGNGITNAVSGTVPATALSTTTFSFGGPDIFRGNIAQALIYNRALSPAEIQQNFEAQRSRFGI